MCEMCDMIGLTAAKVWALLGAEGKVAVERLPKALEPKAMIVYQALGWLAREGKVEYCAKDGKDYVCLTASEQDIFAKSPDAASLLPPKKAKADKKK